MVAARDMNLTYLVGEHGLRAATVLRPLAPKTGRSGLVEQVTWRGVSGGGGTGLLGPASETELGRVVSAR